ncbi:hypothetical protein JMJ77_0003791, partial [Colletotrichum scovillei]
MITKEDFSLGRFQRIVDAWWCHRGHYWADKRRNFKLLVEGSPPLLCITQRLFMRSLCGMK